jgi:hypothetical protein
MYSVPVAAIGGVQLVLQVEALMCSLNTLKADPLQHPPNCPNPTPGTAWRQTEAMAAPGGPCMACCRERAAGWCRRVGRAAAGVCLLGTCSGSRAAGRRGILDEV